MGTSLDSPFRVSGSATTHPPDSPRTGCRVFPWLAAALLLPALPAARAGTVETQTVTVSVPERSPFDRGMRELDFTAGFLYSPVFATHNRPTFCYAQQDLSLGWMLTSPGCPGFFRGNWEFLINAFGAEVTTGPGSFMAGGRLLFRYNFVQPESRFVPFIQIGGGGLGNNIYRHQDQRIIGSGFEFTLVAEAGIRFFICPRWALILTADFEHISNANTASRNVGVNAAGGMLGFGTFF